MIPFMNKKREGIRIIASTDNEVVGNIPPFLLPNVPVLQNDCEVYHLKSCPVEGVPARQELESSWCRSES